MIRVLNIISDSNIGGAGRVILNYLRCADRTRFTPMVALPRGSLLIPELEKLDVEIFPVDGLADRSYHKDDVAALTKLLRQVRPDLVHTHGALSGRIAARRCGIPVVYSRHSAFPVPAKLRYPPGRWVNKFLNEHYADHIIAVSPATRDNLTDGGISPKKISVVMNGVTPLAPLSQEERQTLRRKLGVGGDTLLLGILARIEDYKGHLDLVQAAKLLKQQGRTDFCILVAGTGTFEAEVARAVEEQEVGDVVRLLGFRSDVAALLSVLDVQLNASYATEATSMALLEGMSLSLPSIVSDYGGNPYVIEDGKTGLIFPRRDSAALSRCILRLLDDPQLRVWMGRQAREDFARRFTAQVFARNTEDIYRMVLKGER